MTDLSKSLLIRQLKKLLTDDLIHFDDKIKTDNLLRYNFKKIHNLININASSDYDEEFIDSLGNEDIDKLIRIALLYENIKFMGSVSTIPNLLNKLKQRQYKDLENLFNWVIETNADNNPYIPMGTFKGQYIKTFDKFMSLQY